MMKTMMMTTMMTMMMMMTMSIDLSVLSSLQLDSSDPGEEMTVLENLGWV
jgi:hypothetical protein